MPNERFRYYLLFNADYIHDSIDEGMTKKLKTAFEETTPDSGLSIRGSTGLDISYLHYIIAHEAAHVFDGLKNINVGL